MNFIRKHKTLLTGIVIGYLISRQFGARIETQLRQATASITPKQAAYPPSTNHCFTHNLIIGVITHETYSLFPV